MDKKITPEYVLSLKGPTDHFLCPLSANTYKIRFLAFKLRDMDSGQVLFEIGNPNVTEEDLQEEEEVKIDDNDEASRTIRYQFGPSFFKLKTVGASIKFAVGDNPVKNFRMIERHYFKDQLLQSFDFSFPFCIPNSVNDWENIYEIPKISEELKNEMIFNPYKTVSDSFYFVNGELIMHHKAFYDYTGEE
jgi:GMP-PDE, delta subunit.